MSIHGVLGETTSYPKTYDASVLFPIARSLGRDAIKQQSGVDEDVVAMGMDWWHCFELSWLNLQGVSQVAIMRLNIPATSAFIVESKSLKLYLNSFNLSEFASVSEVKQTIEADLSALLKAQVIAEVSLLDDSLNIQKSGFNIEQASGHCIDDALNDSDKKIAVVSDVDASLLKLLNPTDSNISAQSYCSHLLRSNCPVTNQPDWGTVQIDIECAAIDKASLLEYVLTYRQHNGFHEQCVEQIFADLTNAFAPKKLMVRAWYTRRGGIDINPCRVSDLSLMPKPSRLVRQ